MTTTLVLTVIGDDRPGLVKALAEAITRGGGSWERSHLSELAGKFAGIVTVAVPGDQVAALRAELAPLEGLLDISVHDAAAEPAHQAGADVRIDLLGADQPGIVAAVSEVLTNHSTEVAEFASQTRDAPESGGVLFDAHAVITVSANTDLEALRADLEALTHELMVEFAATTPDE